MIPLTPTISKKIGGVISKHPGRVSVVVILVLLILSIFSLGYKADFSSFSEAPKNTISATGYNELTSAFPAVLNPTVVYVESSSALTQSDLIPLVDKLKDTQGVSSVLPAIIGHNDSIAAISIILKDDPSSPSAISDVAGPIRTAAHSVDVPIPKYMSVVERQL